MHHTLGLGCSFDRPMPGHGVHGLPYGSLIGLTSPPSALNEELLS
jgi:hypothetical protein